MEQIDSEREIKMAEGGVVGNCKQTCTMQTPATSGEFGGNNIELNKNNEQKESKTDSSNSSGSSCFTNSAIKTTTENNVNNTTSKNLLFAQNNSINSSNSNGINKNNNNANNDDEDDDENNQTFYEAAGEPELVLTFEKTLKTTNDVTSSSAPLPPPTFSQFDTAAKISSNNQMQKHQLQLDKQFLSVQMDKRTADGAIDADARNEGDDDMDEECEGAVGIVSCIKDALKDDNEKDLSLLYTTQDDFIHVQREPEPVVEEEEQPVVMRRKRDKSKLFNV